MKYAFYPGCVARGATPELYTSTIAVCEKLGIELETTSMEAASCTGSGVLQEKNQRLGDTLNARNLALGERAELPIMTICSTCQGVMGQAEKRLEDPEYRASVNEDLAEEGLEYKGNPGPRHLLWILLEDYGLEKLKAQFIRPLTGSGWAVGVPVWTPMRTRMPRKWPSSLEPAKLARSRWFSSSGHSAVWSCSCTARHIATAALGSWKATMKASPTVCTS